MSYIYFFVAATMELSTLKRIEVTHLTHHSRRPSRSLATPQHLLMPAAAKLIVKHQLVPAIAVRIIVFYQSFCSKYTGHTD